MAAAVAIAGIDFAGHRRPRGFFGKLGRVATDHPLGVFGFFVLLGFLFLGLFGPSLVPYDPRALRTGKPLAGLSGAHLFGVNQLGQDVFSRILAGARVSLIIAGSSVLIGSSLGAFMGMLSGYRGGWTDYGLQGSVRRLPLSRTWFSTCC